MDTRDDRDLPRVSVNSLEDWARVKNDVANAVLKHVTSRLADSDSSVRRDIVTMYMNKFLSEIFARAKPNMRVNGRNLEDLGETEEDFEPFDEPLDKNIWALADQRLKLDQQVAIKRRTKPQEIRTSLERAFERQNAVPDDDIVPDLGNSGDTMNLDDAIQDRERRLQQIVANVAAITQEVDQSIPIQMGRIGRLGVAAREIKQITP